MSGEEIKLLQQEVAHVNEGVNELKELVKNYMKLSNKNSNNITNIETRVSRIELDINGLGTKFESHRKEQEIKFDNIYKEIKEEILKDIAMQFESLNNALTGKVIKAGITVLSVLIALITFLKFFI